MANIRLLKDYAGRRTNEQRIPPGVYYENDPILCGLGDYLVANGHAVFTDEQLPDPVEVVGASVMVEFDTEGTRVIQELSDDHGAPVYEATEIQDEIEHNGRKIQRRKSKGN